MKNNLKQLDKWQKFKVDRATAIIKFIEVKKVKIMIIQTFALITI
jgi:hypothetical protein